LDLAAALDLGLFDAPAAPAAEAGSGATLNSLFALGRPARVALRRRVSEILDADGPERAQIEGLRAQLLHRAADCRLELAAAIGDYTDFFAGIHHATNAGKLFRPDNPLLPNYKWIPIGYHGRSSSIGVSGQSFPRPRGQKSPSGERSPAVGPSSRLDYELELGIFIGAGNEDGAPIAMADAEQHIFGLCLLNDWSARDLQAWEYQPLGPFLAKNFATTISPWVVTLQALAPFRAPFTRPDADPKPLAYLDSAQNRAAGAIDIKLEALIQTARMRDRGEPPQRLSETSFQHAYWTISQLVAHHTVNGCNLRPGDLLGSGTQSGPTAAEAGSLVELTAGGSQAIQVGTDEERTFLEDGDRVIFRGWCERAGAVTIGFGELQGQVLPARSTS
jgi:fumarylacetoacetase